MTPLIRRYRESDYAELSTWYGARGLSPPPPEGLPLTGLWIPSVGAGFLYRTDSSLALIEGVITNPAAPKRAQACAVAALLRALLDAAGDGARVIGFTSILGMARRAQRLGMRETGAYLLMVK